MRTRQAWGALWWDHLDHLGKGISISLGTTHTLVPEAGSTRRMGAVGCSAAGTGDLLHHQKHPRGKCGGKGAWSKLRSCEGQRDEPPWRLHHRYSCYNSLEIKEICRIYQQYKSNI